MTATTENEEIRIGLVAGGDARRTSALEDLPIDSLWVGGHVASRNPSPEAMMSLARLAALTERVKVGTSILLLPLYPPALVAKQIADLDRATNGRVVLGIGVGGEYPQEFRACEVPIKERGRRTDEMIPLIRRLWTAEEITHEGRYYAMEDVRIHPAPVQAGGPPIVVAGRKEPAMRRAATLGDGWFPYMYSPRRYAASVETVKQAALEAGRDLGAFEWYVWVFVNVNPDGDAARGGGAFDGRHLQPGLRAHGRQRRRRRYPRRSGGEGAGVPRRGGPPLRVQPRHRRRRPPTGDRPALRRHRPRTPGARRGRTVTPTAETRRP